jgi:hypothetical protein
MFLVTTSKTARRLEMAPDRYQKAMYAEFAMSLVTTSSNAHRQVKIKMAALRNLGLPIAISVESVLSLDTGSKTVH